MLKKLLIKAALLAATPAFAQEGLVATPLDLRAKSSQDHARLVEETFPRYENSTLARRLEAAATTLAARPDLIVARSLNGLERLAGLPLTTDPSRGEVDTAAAYYRVDAALGKAFVTLKNDAYLGLSRERFAAVEGRVQQTERAFLARIGVASDEAMKVGFHKLMALGTLPGATEPGDGQPAIVRAGVLSVHRGYAGFPIEGSFARLSSFDGQKVETMLLSWPKFKLHPEVQSFELAAQADVKLAVLRKIRRAIGEGEDIALTMGVVFRPAKTLRGELIHLPALKVVVTPQDKRIPDQSGRIQTDGGLEFFASLLKVSPRIQADDLTDAE